MHSNSDTIKIYEAYKIHPEQKAKVSLFGKWSPLDGISVNAEQKWKRRANLMGYNFKIATLYAPPYVTIMEKIDENLYNLEGMFIEVFHALQVVSMHIKPSIQNSHASIKHSLGCHEFHLHCSSPS